MPVASRSRASRSTRNWSALVDKLAQFVEFGIVARRRSRRRRGPAAAAGRRWRCAGHARWRRVRRVRRAARPAAASPAGRAGRATAGSSDRPSRRVDRSRGRALRRATRERMRSMSPRLRKASRRASSARCSISVCDRVVALAEHPAVAQRAVQPAPQQAPAHRRDGGIQHAQQGVLACRRRRACPAPGGGAWPRSSRWLRRWFPARCGAGAAAAASGFPRRSRAARAAAAIASGRSSRPKPVRSCTPKNCSSWRRPASASNSHGARRRRPRRCQ